MKYILSVIFAVMLVSCTSESTLPAEDTTQSEEQGRADAQALCDANFTTDRDLHSALLAVKAREWQIRANADSIQSAAYIDAFRTHLQEAAPALYHQIF